MQIIAVNGSRSDLTDLMAKLQNTLVPEYFESITLTPCEGSSPTQADPSTITFKYSNGVYIDLFIGSQLNNDYIEIRGNDITGTGKIRYGSGSGAFSILPITHIIVTDSGVALYNNLNNWTSSGLLVIGKNDDGNTCIFAPASFSGNEPYTISNFIGYMQSQSGYLSYDLGAGKAPNDYIPIYSEQILKPTLPYIAMQKIPTINGKPFKDVFIPMYNPFSSHYPPFNFIANGVSYAAINACYVIFKDTST